MFYTHRDGTAEQCGAHITQCTFGICYDNLTVVLPIFDFSRKSIKLRCLCVIKFLEQAPKEMCKFWSHWGHFWSTPHEWWKFYALQRPLFYTYDHADDDDYCCRVNGECIYTKIKQKDNGVIRGVTKNEEDAASITVAIVIIGSLSLRENCAGGLIGEIVSGRDRF